ncbi:hypothetical protein ID866_3862 [Astraeus odoratus]|nr:hypothetical protein ID866_3862 [Astraeus odoratus]
MPVDYVPLPDNVNYGKQSVEVPGTKRPGQTAHYHNGEHFRSIAESIFNSFAAIFGLLDTNAPTALKTLPDVFNNGYSMNPDAKLLGHRPLLSKTPLKFGPYVWQTYRQVDVRRRRIGSALHHMFNTGELKATDLETVGLWSQNRPEWQLVDLALHAYGKVGVSLYDTLGKESDSYFLCGHRLTLIQSIDHAQLSIVFTSPDHIAALLRLASKVPNLKVIVSFDTLDDEVRSVFLSWAESLSIRIMDLTEFESYGEANLIDPIPVTPDQIASLCYTSVTPFLFRSRELLFNPLQAQSSHMRILLPQLIPICSGLISRAPAVLCHICRSPTYTRFVAFPRARQGDVLIPGTQRICELTTIAIGGNIGYFTGDPLRLMDDAQALKPHFFPSVPRVLNRIYQAAMAAGNAPGLKGAIFRTALQTKLDQLHETGVNTHAFWDALVFRKIRAVLGGNILLLVTGSAPISAEVVDFLKIAFSCDVTEGMACFSCQRNLSLTFLQARYGMTENCATCTHTLGGDPTGGGTIGPPAPINEIKLVDIPSMNYFTNDKPNPRGELCVRGKNCFSGYYKDEKNTTETLKDGWIHTGDVAEIDDHGRFKIIDRVKACFLFRSFVFFSKPIGTQNIMKLAQGEYVALEKIENTYSRCPIIQQIYVHGDSLQSYLLAVVVPDPLALAPVVSAILGKKIDASDTPVLTEAVKNPQVVQEVLNLLNAEAKKDKLAGFEFVKRIHVTMDPFTVEDNTLTPTLKLRRSDAYVKFKKELDALYALGEPTIKSASKL